MIVKGTLREPGLLELELGPAEYFQDPEGKILAVNDGDSVALIRTKAMPDIVATKPEDRATLRTDGGLRWLELPEVERPPIEPAPEASLSPPSQGKSA